jgi:hypothetical protein
MLCQGSITRLLHAPIETLVMHYSGCIKSCGEVVLEVRHVHLLVHTAFIAQYSLNCVLIAQESLDSALIAHRLQVRRVQLRGAHVCLTYAAVY